jgi:hypothetical protein
MGSTMVFFHHIGGSVERAMTRDEIGAARQRKRDRPQAVPSKHRYKSGDLAVENRYRFRDERRTLLTFDFHSGFHLHLLAASLGLH